MLTFIIEEKLSLLASEAASFFNASSIRLSRKLNTLSYKEQKPLENKIKANTITHHYRNNVFLYTHWTKKVCTQSKWSKKRYHKLPVDPN